MKCRITIEQLNDLTSSQKQKLRDLWIPIAFDTYKCGQNDYVCQVTKDNTLIKKEYTLPLLDIGQMIGLIGNEIGVIKIDSTITNWKFKLDQELCDALWDVTKEIL